MPLYHAAQYPTMHVPPPNERLARVLMAPETTGYETNSIFLAVIPPGGAIPDHVHPNNDEIMYCVGTGEALVDGVRSPVSTDSVILAYRGVVHGIWNTSPIDPLRLFCVFVPAIKEPRFEDLMRRTSEFLQGQELGAAATATS